MEKNARLTWRSKPCANRPGKLRELLVRAEPLTAGHGDNRPRDRVDKGEGLNPAKLRIEGFRRREHADLLTVWVLHAHPPIALFGVVSRGILPDLEGQTELRAVGTTVQDRAVSRADGDPRQGTERVQPNRAELFEDDTQWEKRLGVAVCEVRLPRGRIWRWLGRRWSGVRWRHGGGPGRLGRRDPGYSARDNGRKTARRRGVGRRGLAGLGARLRCRTIRTVHAGRPTRPVGTILSIRTVDCRRHGHAWTAGLMRGFARSCFTMPGGVSSAVLDWRWAPAGLIAQRSMRTLGGCVCFRARLAGILVGLRFALVGRPLERSLALGDGLGLRLVFAAGAAREGHRSRRDTSDQGLHVQASHGRFAARGRWGVLEEGASTRWVTPMGRRLFLGRGEAAQEDRRQDRTSLAQSWQASMTTPDNGGPG